MVADTDRRRERTTAEARTGGGPGPTEEIGQIAQVAPTNLEFTRRKLFASAWIVAIFFGRPGRGEVVRIAPGSLRRP